MAFLELRDALRADPGRYLSVDGLCCADCPGFVVSDHDIDRLPNAWGFCTCDGEPEAVDGTREACGYLLDELDDLAQWVEAQKTLEQDEQWLAAYMDGDA